MPSHEDPTALGDRVDGILEEVGFAAEATHLTERQAQVLALRKQGVTQATIADWLECSRANVSSIEGSARRNLEKAERTVTLGELLAAPVRVEIPTGIDLYEVPDRIYAASDRAEVKVNHGAPELIRAVRETAPGAIVGGRVSEELIIHVAADGSVRVHVASD